MEIKITVALALAAFASAPVWGQTGRISSISVSSGVVTLTERIGTAGNAPLSVGDNRAGLAYAAGTLPGASDTSISLFTLTGAAIPGGVTNPADVFTSYGTLIFPTNSGNYADVKALVTANSYAGLTFAIDNLSLPSAGSFYTIHHKAAADYFSVITPATGGVVRSRT